MTNIFNNLYSLIKNIKNNIAFYPTVLAFFGFVLSLLMMILEQYNISKFLLDHAPILVVEGGDTALNILSVCITGLISMMVFSFSMVMLLLSQASSNFSPRLLPGLVSDRRNQTILGLYLSTIIYNIFTMFAIEPSKDEYNLPGFTILLGIVGTIVCLGAFIYFIHNMSQSIQISQILDTIYEKAKNRLAKMIDLENNITATLPETYNIDDWHAYKYETGGYFQDFKLYGIIEFCKSNETKILLAKPKGLFILKNETFFYSEKKLNKDQLEAFYPNIYMSKNELVTENYNLAFKQISEIIVKAMSPGINDPGTALNGIDYLTELFAMRLLKSNSEWIIDKENNTCYGQAKVITFSELITNTMASLRTYCKHDPIVVQKLLLMLQYLEKQKKNTSEYNEVIKEQITILVKQSQDVFQTKKDRELLQQIIN